MYAITSQNKILAVYFGTLVLTRLTVPLASSFAKSPVFVDLPPVPLDAFNICAVTVDLKLMLIPSSVGAAFGTWLPLF